MYAFSQAVKFAMNRHINDVANMSPRVRTPITTWRVLSAIKCLPYPFLRLFAIPPGKDRG